MKITDTLREEIGRAVKRSGGAGEFARRCGIDAANISRYLSGRVNSISDANWEKLAKEYKSVIRIIFGPLVRYVFNGYIRSKLSPIGRQRVIFSLR